MGGDRQLHELQPTKVNPAVGDSTPCGAVSSGRITAFVPDSLSRRCKAFCSEDGIVYSPGAGGFANPSQSAISQSGVGGSKPCGAVSTRKTTVFVPDLV